MRKLLAVAGAVALLAGCASGPKEDLAANAGAMAAALADSTRPEADRARDAVRRPAELLALSGVGPGDKVGDLIMGGGYLTRVLALAVGSSGRVYAYQPAEFVSFRAQYATDQDTVAAAHPNVTPVRGPLRTLSFAEPLDAVITVQNYHDLHLKPMGEGTAAAVNKAVFQALKPGGVYVIVDHSATKGAPLSVADSLHRIDQERVVREVKAAGFKLESEHDMYRLPSDTRAVNVFDPAIRGKTDQFVLKFKKPA